MDKLDSNFDWKAILRSDSVLGASNRPEDILQNAGDCRILPKANVDCITLIMEDTADDPAATLINLLSVDYDCQNNASLMRMCASRFQPFAEMARIHLLHRGALN